MVHCDCFKGSVCYICLTGWQSFCSSPWHQIMLLNSGATTWIAACHASGSVNNIEFQMTHLWAEIHPCPYIVIDIRLLINDISGDSNNSTWNNLLEVSTLLSHAATLSKVPSMGQSSTNLDSNSMEIQVFIAQWVCSVVTSFQNFQSLIMALSGPCGTQTEIEIFLPWWIRC